MFDQMVDSIREDTVKMLLRIEVRPVAQSGRPAPQTAPQPAAAPAAQPAPAAPMAQNAPAAPGAEDVAALRQKLTGQSAGAQAAAAGQLSGAANKPVPCPCGSGLKWKKCTCREYHPDLYAKKQ